MKRILILGCCGAGKSTLAKAIAARTNLELIHLDQHYFEPNWVETPPDKWATVVEKLAAKDAWIIDGNYGGTMDIRLQRADTIVYLDRSRCLCLYRVIKRIFQNHGKVRADAAPGCAERIDWEFLHYVLMFNTIKRPRHLERLAALPSDKAVFILRSDQAVTDFLGTFFQNKKLNS